MTKLPTVLGLVVAMVLVVAMPAGATPPTDSTIENLIPDFNNPAPTDFTATGGVVCASGSVTNEFFKASGNGNNGVNFQVIKKFTCEDGSGDFFLKLQVKLSFETSTTTFNWNVVDGTGAYADLHGSGTGFSTLCGFGCIVDHYTGGFHIDP